jgi:NAD(P)-dependent dehydrogenase (short-subunit alcohol dehydrogenase family)
MTSWTDDKMPDLTGKVALVTGATGGLGLRSAEVLAAHGARVFLGSRNDERGAAALETVSRAASGAAPELVQLDLADLGDVRRAADSVRERSAGGVDLLLNSAGIMAPPLQYSVDGFELQWATNVLGHMALTWHLLPMMVDLPGSRVVTITSLAHRRAKMDAERIESDLRGERYSPFEVYGRTKLANLLFARELDRRLRSTGAKTISVAAHPGLASTNIASNIGSDAPAPVNLASSVFMRSVGQPVEQGALPLLFAATFPGVRGGQFIAPRGPGELRGRPTAVNGSRRSRDEGLARTLWQIVSETTSVNAPL